MQFRHVATHSGPALPFATNITDLHAYAGRDGHALFSLTQTGGGMTAYRITSAEQPIRMTASQPYAPTLRHAGTPLASIVDLGAGPVLFGTGPINGLDAGIALGPDGGFLGGPLSGPGGLAADVIRLGQFQTPMGSFLFTARDGQTAFDIWRIGADGALVHISRAALPLGPGIQGAEIDAMQVATLADRSYLVTASALGNYLAVQLIQADGSVGGAQMLWADDGLGLNQPRHLGMVTVSGVTYVIVASAQSSSLTTLRLTYEGTLIPADHIIDELTTRFQGATALETVMMEGRAFVFVGGGDDGISVFTVMPDGKLLHLATLADANDRTLADVSAISALVIGGKIALFVSSATESGITQFVFEPGSIGLTRTVDAGEQSGGDGSDMLFASTDTTILRGGAGDDILIAAGNPLEVYGGEGADIFVAKEVNGRILIRDFELGVDRLDLSLLGMIRSTGQLRFVPQKNGIKILYGNSELRVMTRDKATLQASAFDNSLFPVTHYAAPNMRTLVLGNALANKLSAVRFGSKILGYGGDDTLIGGVGRDYMNGGLGNDRLAGGDGNDSLGGDLGHDYLSGGNGNDLLYGGGDRDTLYGGAGLDTLHGGAGNDLLLGEDGNDHLSDIAGHNTLSGGAGNDHLVTAAGHDLLYGGSGFDTLLAGAGHDSLFGGTGNDSLNGEAGNDLLDGGDGDDTLLGGADSDQVLGGEGNDLIHGNAGHDTLNGQTGADRIYGDDGHDLLYGGLGNDTLFGGTGADTLYGYIGDDLVYAGNDNDLILGGDGHDTLHGQLGDDLLRGGEGQDSMTGGLGHDLILGDGGNDSLFGQDGNDVIQGGSGNDLLSGGDGSDTLTGGAGADLFVFSDLTGAGGGSDVITDFVRGTDRIDLSGLGLTFIGATAFSDAGQVRSEITDGVQRLLVDLDGDGRAELVIGLGGIGPIGATDLLL